MKTISEVKAALVAVVRWLKTANGFANNIADDHVTDRYDANLLSNPSDSLYPKIMVFPVWGDNTNLPGVNEERILDFVILAVVKEIEREDDSVTMAESLLNDFEKLFHDQHNLFGTVLDARITEFTTDGGATHPEGSIILRVRTQRFK